MSDPLGWEVAQEITYNGRQMTESMSSSLSVNCHAGEVKRCKGWPRSLTSPSAYATVHTELSDVELTHSNNVSESKMFRP